MQEQILYNNNNNTSLKENGFIVKEKVLEDIKNFVETKGKISNFYYNKYKNLLTYENNADKYWLVSDIILFTKRNNFSSYIIISKIYNKYIICKNSIYNQLSLFWGKLTTLERNHFIQIRSNNQ